MNSLRKITGAYMFSESRIFDYYHLMSVINKFDKMVQAGLFSMYKASSDIDKITGIPNEAKSSITTEMIEIEIEDQWGRNLEYTTGIMGEIAGNMTAAKHLDFIRDTIEEWENFFMKVYKNGMDIVTPFEYIHIDFSKYENGTDFYALSFKDQSKIMLFGLLAPILFEFCKLDVNDVLYNSDKFDEKKKTTKKQSKEIRDIYRDCGYHLL